MKRTFTGILCCVVLLFGHWSFAGEQVTGELVNGGFEETKEGIPAFWKFLDPADGMLLDDVTFFEGSRSVQVFLKQPESNTARLQQEVEVEAGKRYDLGGLIKVDLNAGFAKIMVVFLDKKGDEIETFALPKLSHNRNWVYQSMWVKSPNGSDAARIICKVKGSGKAWFDDIHFSSKLRGGY